MKYLYFLIVLQSTPCEVISCTLRDGEDFLNELEEQFGDFWIVETDSE